MAESENTKEGKEPEQAEPGPIGESIQRAQAKANLQRALDSMARLRRTIDRRPSGLTGPRKTPGR